MFHLISNKNMFKIHTSGSTRMDSHQDSAPAKPVLSQPTWSPGQRPAAQKGGKLLTVTSKRELGRVEAQNAPVIPDSQANRQWLQDEDDRGRTGALSNVRLPPHPHPHPHPGL